MAKGAGKKGIGIWSTLTTTVSAISAKIEGDLHENDSVAMQWQQALAHLDDAKGKRLRMSELADRLSMSRSGLTRLLDRIESEGYVKREASENDRRGYYAVLTKTGERALDQAHPAMETAVQRHFTRHLSGSDLKALADILGKLDNSK